MISATTAKTTERAVRQIESILRQRHHVAGGAPVGFPIRTQKEFQEMKERVYDLMTLLLVAVAAVSLFVGGIGVMNIMLVSVTERTREIGIRMAIGARARDIRTQFLVEAITLAALGGILGALCIDRRHRHPPARPRVEDGGEPFALGPSEHRDERPRG